MLFPKSNPRDPVLFERYRALEQDRITLDQADPILLRLK
jgi:hypothetical protein